MKRHGRGLGLQRENQDELANTIEHHENITSFKNITSCLCSPKPPNQMFKKISFLCSQAHEYSRSSRTQHKLATASGSSRMQQKLTNTSHKLTNTTEARNCEQKLTNTAEAREYSTSSRRRAEGFTRAAAARLAGRPAGRPRILEMTASASSPGRLSFFTKHLSHLPSLRAPRVAPSRGRCASRPRGGAARLVLLRRLADLSQRTHKPFTEPSRSTHRTLQQTLCPHNRFLFKFV